MISNLRYAAHNREKIMIGGGEFGPADFTMAANMLEQHALLVEALKTLQAFPNDPRAHRQAMDVLKVIA